jgi:N-acetyl sugar amidotransferase
MIDQTLKRCTKCTLPETHETITFNEEGVCNICQGQDIKQAQINWDERKRDLDALVEQYRGKYDYDCIVPCSFGKDSTWTLHYLVKEYGLKPLVVRFDHGFYRPNINENAKRVQRKLGVDVHQFTPNWKVVQKLMLQAFLEKGDFCWHCHTGIFSYPMWVALRYNVPLIFWGEPSAEYTNYYSYDQPEEVDEKRFNRFVNLGINADDMYVRLEGKVDKRDLMPFSYPPLKQLRQLQSKIISDELGWQGDEVENVPPEYNYEKIECYMQGVRDYIKYIKRGYTRPTHLTSIDIRNDRMDRYHALDIIDQYEGKRPPSLDLFLDFVGLTEAEFMEVAMQHQVSPYHHDPTKITDGKKLPDFEAWSRDGKMQREEAEYQIRRWRESTQR